MPSPSMRPSSSLVPVWNKTHWQARGLVGWFIGNGIGVDGANDGTAKWWNLVTNTPTLNVAGTGTCARTASAPMGLVATTTATASLRSAVTNLGLGTSNVTLNVWLYLTGSVNGGAIYVGNDAAGYGIGIGSTDWTGAGTNVIGLFGGKRWVNSSVSYGGAGWHMLTLRLPSGGGGVALYLDGRQIYSDTSGSPSSPTTHVSVGSEEATRFLATSYADARFYALALTDAEILSLWTPSTRWDLYWRPSSRVYVYLSDGGGASGQPLVKRYSGIPHMRRGSVTFGHGWSA